MSLHAGEEEEEKEEKGEEEEEEEETANNTCKTKSNSMSACLSFLERDRFELLFQPH